MTNRPRCARPTVPDADEPSAPAGRGYLIQFAVEALICVLGAPQRSLGVLQCVAQSLPERGCQCTRIADRTRIFHGTRITRIARIVHETSRE